MIHLLLLILLNPYIIYIANNNFINNSKIEIISIYPSNLYKTHN